MGAHLEIKKATMVGAGAGKHEEIYLDHVQDEAEELLLVFSERT